MHVASFIAQYSLILVPAEKRLEREGGESGPVLARAGLPFEADYALPLAVKERPSSVHRCTCIYHCNGFHDVLMCRNQALCIFILIVDRNCAVGREANAIENRCDATIVYLDWAYCRRNNTYLFWSRTESLEAI